MQILLVDDDATIVRTVQAILERAGYTVATASSGGDALGRLRHERFDLLITDLYMPGLDGFELLVMLRSVVGFLPVLVMSGGHESLNMLQAVTSLGAVHALAKPFGAAALLEAVALIIGGMRENPASAANPSALTP